LANRWFAPLSCFDPAKRYLTLNRQRHPNHLFIRYWRAYQRRIFSLICRPSKAWETEASLAEQSSIQADFAHIWQAADKVVFSRSLDSPLTTRTRIQHTFDPEKIRQMKAAVESDLSIGGPELAAEAFKYDLIDECHLFLAPISIGCGKRSLPRNHQLILELTDQRRFPDGMMYLRYYIRR
jgi:riboflavin biosynthesis pyrimidine reductase